ncbi:MAG: hypothetical protein WCN98_05995 [Verrucomicrobiaceae bacterium]
MSAVFHRVIIEAWHQKVPLIAFALTFSVFAISFIRALLMRKERAADLSHIPLDGDAERPVADDGQKH